MNKFELYKILRRHEKLSEKRSPMFERSRAAKYMQYAGGAFLGLYFAFLAVICFMIYWKSGCSYDIIGVIFPFLLIFDFFIRFAAIQTPAQRVKQYILLPIPRKAITNNLLINTLTNSFNLFLFCFLVPYGYLAIFFAEGFWSFLIYLIGCWLIILINSQWYLFCRTFINRHLLWWLLPICGYALFFLPLIIAFIFDNELIVDRYLDILGNVYCNYLVQGNALVFSIIILVLVGAFLINRKIQAAFVYNEVTRKNEVKIHKVSKMAFFDRFGSIGEYLKLEVKSILRCTVVKSQFWSGVGVVVMFTVFIYFDFYNDMPGMKDFALIYNFAIFSVMFNSRIMSKEGNYIDCLMTHKENILSLFHAKYIITCMMQVVPFILLIPVAIKGNISILGAVAFMFFGTGPINFSLFILAIFAKDTMSLWDKVQTNSGNSKMQFISSISVFLAPLLIYNLLLIFFSDTVSLIIIMILGILFTAASPWWLKYIYQRMMFRRYCNMDGFRETRK